MRTRIGINGLGAVGRTVLRALNERTDRCVEVVAVNDVAPVPALAHLLRHDSTYGTWSAVAGAGDHHLRIDGRRIRCLSQARTEDLDWRRHGVDIVVETPRGLRGSETAHGHLTYGGARKTVLAMAGAAADVTVLGRLNDDVYDPARHDLVAVADAGTTCAATLLHVLDQAFGVEYAMVTTVCGYTGEEHVLDTPDPDLRWARSAVTNIIATGSPITRHLVQGLPGLAGRVDGLAVHVPVPDAALVDIAARLGARPAVADIDGSFRAAADGPLKGLLRCTDEPIVSGDVLGEAASCLLDRGLTSVRGDLVRVAGWYDRRWSVAERVVDLVELVARTLPPP
jgi:glyceraldehyde 3-phosphate dehydrogenase